MNITGNVTVQIDWEQESEIIRQILRADYCRLANDCVRLMQMEDLEDYQKEDLMNNIESMQGFLKTLEYYTYLPDHEAWLNEVSGISPELQDKISG